MRSKILAFDKLVSSPNITSRVPNLSSLQSLARKVLQLKPPHPEHVLAWEMAKCQGIAAHIIYDEAVAIQGYRCAKPVRLGSIQ